MVTVNPASANRRASPRPCSPVPPMMPMRVVATSC